MPRKCFLLCLICIFVPVLGRAETFDVKCFTHLQKNGVPINIKFSTMFVALDKYRLGYVVYEKSKEPIPLYFVSNFESVFEEGRPYEVVAKWREIINEELAGEYTVVSQGAVVYDFSYKSKAGEVFRFIYNSMATYSGQGDCNWHGG